MPNTENYSKGFTWTGYLLIFAGCAMVITGVWVWIVYALAEEPLISAFCAALILFGLAFIALGIALLVAADKGPPQWQ